MTPQDNLNTANDLGRTIALLAAQSAGSTTNNAKVIDNLIAALAGKAQALLNPVEVKAASIGDEIIMGAGDTAIIHGNGNVQIKLCADTAQTATSIGHASDCATNNRGVPELLGPCDCMGDAANFAPVVAGPTLQSYFEGELARGVIDFSLRTCRMPDGLVGFYVHPAMLSGETAQFIVNGNALTTHMGA